MLNVTRSSRLALKNNNADGAARVLVVPTLRGRRCACLVVVALSACAWGCDGASPRNDGGGAGSGGAGGANEHAVSGAGGACELVDIGQTLFCSFDEDGDADGVAFKEYTPDDPEYANLSSNSSLSWDGAEGEPSPGAIRVEVPFDDYRQFVELEYDFSTPFDLSDGYLFVKLKILPGFSHDPLIAPGVNLFVKTGVDWTFTSSWTSLTGDEYGEWVEFAFYPERGETYGNTAADFTQVVTFGLQLHAGDPGSGEVDPEALPAPATFFVDSIGYRPSDSTGSQMACLEPPDDTENHVVLAPFEHPASVPTGRWRGFNLVGRFAKQWPETNQGFNEQAFATMADLGFNYARLPVDYRAYTHERDWLILDRETIATIDDAVTWAQKYGIRADLCLHRAPGYCVNDYAGRIVELPDEQDLDLWTDPIAQNAFVDHWRLLASRYQDIPPEHLTFNLVNEPADVDEPTYVDLMVRTIEAIREITPDRVIVVDGLDTANVPITDPELLAYDDIVQSKHAYDFKKLQWYDTIFTPGSDTWSLPHWPPTLLGAYLYGPWQADNVDDGPLVIEGDFPTGTTVTLHVNDVNLGARLVVTSDAETLVDESLTQQADDSGWRVVDVWEGTEIYGKHYDEDFTATLTEAATELVFDVTEENFLDFTELRLEMADRSITYVPVLDWGVPQATFRLAGEALEVVSYPDGAERYYDLDHYLDEWKALAEMGVEVIVGEFSQSDKTPYEDAYRFNEFMLTTCEEAGFGWAFWDFDSTNPPNGGAFINNEREGASYEDYDGYQLDRNMLELFQAH